MSEGDKEGLLALEKDNGKRQITELLLEQVECADVVIINKVNCVFFTFIYYIHTHKLVVYTP